jgi:hypothetical protein
VPLHCGCMWPPSVGNPTAPRNSHHPGIADFFLAVNAGTGAGGTKTEALAAAAAAGCGDDEEGSDGESCPYSWPVVEIIPAMQSKSTAGGGTTVIQSCPIACKRLVSTLAPEM